MISAIQYGKIRVNFAEDSLTSSVFDHLLLLPDEMFWKIVKKSCFGNSLPENITSIDEYEFWPRWDAKNTTRSTYIEPDMFIGFNNFAGQV